MTNYNVIGYVTLMTSLYSMNTKRIVHQGFIINTACVRRLHEHYAQTCFSNSIANQFEPELTQSVRTAHIGIALSIAICLHTYLATQRLQLHTMHRICSDTLSDDRIYFDPNVFIATLLRTRYEQPTPKTNSVAYLKSRPVYISMPKHC